MTLTQQQQKSRPIRRWAPGPALGLALLLAGGTGAAKPAWQLSYSMPNSGNVLAHLDAVDEAHAWAVGVEQGMGSSSPVGLRTVDGMSWQPMMLPPAGGGPLDLTMFTLLGFVDADVGYLAGAQVGLSGEFPLLWRTDNGGLSFTPMPAPPSTLVELQALPTGELFGVGGSTLIRSTDGQQLDTIVPAVPGGLPLTSIFMLNESCGYVVATSATSSAVLWSGDGAESWEVRSEGLPLVANRAWFVSANLGWLAADTPAGAGVIARTTDGGRSFAPVAIPDHPPVMGTETVPTTSCVDVRFFDDQRGVGLCLACTAGCDSTEEQPSYLTVIVRSDDGGQSWQWDPDYEPVMNAPPFGDLLKFSGLFTLDFPTPNSGFVAGQNNLILRYQALEPEPEGWGTPSCEPTTSGGGGAGSSSGSGAAGAGDPELSEGCGCRTLATGQGAGPALWLTVALFALCRVRRRD